MVDIIRSRSRKKLVHAYVDQDLLDIIEDISEKRGISKAEVLRNALRKGVGLC